MRRDLKRSSSSEPAREHTIAFRGGGYSLVITAIMLALLIVVNIFASALPTSMTKYDISASKLYSITSNTKVVVNALEEDVTIYWIVQSGKEDEVIENLLSKYESLSDHIEIVKKNPDVFPTFAEQYTDETVSNNSLVVECGERSRFIGYDDIYLQEADLYSYSYNTSFDGEGSITSAIDYVVNEEQPQLYLLEGHGEAELPASFREQIEKENMECSTFSLLTADGVPEERSNLWTGERHFRRGKGAAGRLCDGRWEIAGHGRTHGKRGSGKSLQPSGGLRRKHGGGGRRRGGPGALCLPVALCAPAGHVQQRDHGLAD